MCESDMWLTTIEPEEPGCDRWTFECPRCQHVIVTLIRFTPASEHETGYIRDSRCPLYPPKADMCSALANVG